MFYFNLKSYIMFVLLLTTFRKINFQFIRFIVNKERLLLLLQAVAYLDRRLVHGRGWCGGGGVRLASAWRWGTETGMS